MCFKWKNQRGREWHWMLENRQTTGVPIAIHMILAIFIWWIECIQLIQTNGDLLETCACEWLHLSRSFLCATHRFTKNAYENKSHNFVCPLEKWYWFSLCRKTPCKFNWIYWQPYTNTSISFHDSIVCGNDEK